MQRQHVRDHAGSASQHVAAGRDGEAKNQILCAGQAMQEDRRRRTYDLSYACAGAVCDRAQIVRTPMRQVGSIAQEATPAAPSAVTPPEPVTADRPRD